MRAYHRDIWSTEAEVRLGSQLTIAWETPHTDPSGEWLVEQRECTIDWSEIISLAVLNPFIVPVDYIWIEETERVSGRENQVAKLSVRLTGILRHSI